MLEFYIVFAEIAWLYASAKAFIKEIFMHFLSSIKYNKNSIS